MSKEIWPKNVGYELCLLQVEVLHIYRGCRFVDNRKYYINQYFIENI